MIEKNFRIPVVMVRSGWANVKAENLDEAIKLATDSKSAEYDFNDSYDYDQVGYRVEKDFEEVESWQDTFYDLETVEGGGDIIDKTWEHNFSSEEWDVINKILTYTNIGEWLWVDQFYAEGDRVDLFYDAEDNKYMTLQDGLKILEDGISWAENDGHIDKNTEGELYDAIVKIKNDIKKKCERG